MGANMELVEPLDEGQYLDTFGYDIYATEIYHAEEEEEEEEEEAGVDEHFAFPNAPATPAATSAECTDDEAKFLEKCSKLNSQSLTAEFATLASPIDCELPCAVTADRVATKEGQEPGVLIALSIPLLITGRNIFMSYNFEANYNMPTDSTDFTQGILKKGDNDQIHEAEARKARMIAPTPKRSSISRKKFYRAIELNLQRYGFAGKRCILRMICDLADAPLHHENGVLGDVLQLIFTPSLSQDENLPSEFARAEELGREHKNCNKYRAHCPASPIDLVTIVLGQ
uniref:Uncharacterized protein n=1 Tax=Anopheles maculatus TaxID=74869 RepID=A0A182S8E1_9DIPT